MTAHAAARFTVGSEHVVLSAHAAKRYHEDVRPTLPTRDAAVKDLLRVVQLAGAIHDEAPEWRKVPIDGEPPPPAACWLAVGDDIAFPIIDGVAVTCITRGTISEEMRSARMKNRRERATRRKGIRQTGQGHKVTDSGRPSRRTRL